MRRHAALRLGVGFALLSLAGWLCGCPTTPTTQSCPKGYTGTNCASCAAGYQDRDVNGTCTADCATAALDCNAANGGGQCDDSSGTAVCTCATGYTGAACDGCAFGYQDNDANGTCTADCTTLGLDCNAAFLGGQCDDSSGTPVCVCATGYTGAACDTCASGYQDNDANGTCSADCATAALGCNAANGGGQCDDSSGTAVCVCAPHYTGTDCASCASGYQDNDANGTCSADCATAALACNAANGGGQCDDSSGTAICACATGYAGADCTSCAAGYADITGNGTCQDASCFTLPAGLPAFSGGIDSSGTNLVTSTPPTTGTGLAAVAAAAQGATTQTTVNLPVTGAVVTQVGYTPTPPNLTELWVVDADTAMHVYLGSSGTTVSTLPGDAVSFTVTRVLELAGELEITGLSNFTVDSHANPVYVIESNARQLDYATDGRYVNHVYGELMSAGAACGIRTCFSFVHGDPSGAFYTITFRVNNNALPQPLVQGDCIELYAPLGLGPPNAQPMFDVTNGAWLRWFGHAGP